MMSLAQMGECVKSAPPSRFHEWAGESVPFVVASLHPLTMPLYVKEQIFDIVLAEEIKRIDTRKTKARGEAAAPAAMSLLDAKVSEVLDAKVSEVLENGGFSFVRRKDGGEVYEYERLSRDGQPLKGREAAKPPRYLLVRWGTMILRCSCQAARGTSDPCKHQKALAWWLGLPTGKPEQASEGAEQT